MIRPFSIRHRKAIVIEKKLKFSISVKLRQRIWQVLSEYNMPMRIQPDRWSSWEENSCLLDEVFGDLKKIYGVSQLQIFTNPGNPYADNLEEFVEGAYPSQVLDVAEIVCSELPADVQPKFQAQINEAFEIEEHTWRLSDGQFFQVDSDFLKLELASRAQEMMQHHGFKGAYQEFREARNDLTNGDTKGAITNACKSMESVLKKLLNTPTGTADDLIDMLHKESFFADLPANKHAIIRKVLKSLPLLRNELGAHGDGKESIAVPKAYADLAVNLAASLSYFLISKHIATLPKPPSLLDMVKKPDEEEDLPF